MTTLTAQTLTALTGISTAMTLRPGAGYTTEREAAYQAALQLVANIDEDLTRGIRHYRNKGGGLLTTLDEVIRPIVVDELAVTE